MSLNTKLATAPNTSDTYILKASGSTIGDSIMYQDSGGGMNVAYSGTTGGARIRITPDSPQGYIEAYSGGGSFYKLVLATGGLSVRSGVSTVLMEVDTAGKVGIGTSSPEGVLTVVGTSAQPPTSGTTANSLLQLVGSLNNQLNIGSNTVAGGYGSYIQSSDNNLAVPYPLNLQPNGGVVSIGNTNPQTLFDANVRGMVFGNYSSLSSNSSSGWTSLANNAAQTIGSSEASGWSYQNTDAAARFALTNGGFAFQVSGTGTSGTAISWTQAMTILNAAGGGKVGIGTNSPATILELGGASNKDMGIVSTQQTSYVSVYDQGMWLSVNRRITDGTFSNTSLSSANIFLNGANGGSEIQFRTAAANNTAPTERMRIMTNGAVSYGNGGYVDIEWAGGGGAATHTLDLATAFPSISFTGVQITAVCEVQTVNGTTAGSSYIVMFNRTINGSWASTTVATINNGGGTISSSSGSGTTLTINHTGAGAMRGQVRVTIRG